MKETDHGPALFLSMMACVAGIAVLASPAPLPDRPASAHEAAWIAVLHAEMGPALGDCVWSSVSARVEPERLMPILERANDDHRLFPYLGEMVAQARARCSQAVRVATTD